MALSERQEKILNFVRLFTRENGYPPTIREIGEAVEISSTSVVNYNLNALQREGLIFRDKTVSRGIKLVEKQEATLNLSHLISVPMLGHIAAGEPIDVPAGAYNSEDMVQVPVDLVSKGDNLYALKVKGTSMIDALINDGDIVVMQHAVSAENGEMVAAWLTDRDETTLKRFFNEGSQVRLQPENVTMAPIFVDPKVVQVQGKVVAVLRSLG